jgi:signal transduction histidine kinase
LRTKGKPNPALYEVRKEALSLIEQQAEDGNIDLFYADETQFSQQGYVPYG